MSNLLVIGQTGTLGSYLQRQLRGIPCNIRFHQAQSWKQLFTDNQIDTIIHTARCCRKTSPRRDYATMREEIIGMINILDYCNFNAHFIYISSKTVLGITSESEHWLTPESIFPTIQECINGKHVNQAINLPNNAVIPQYTKKLSSEHEIYANTKIACENLVKSRMKKYSILRVWDILPYNASSNK